MFPAYPFSAQFPDHARRWAIAELPDLWTLPFRYEDTWTRISEEGPSCLIGTLPFQAARHADWGSNQVSSVCVCHPDKSALQTAQQQWFTQPCHCSTCQVQLLLKLQAYTHTHTQFWLISYNTNPHTAPKPPFYCHGPFSPVQEASDTLAGASPTSHYLGQDPKPSRDLDSVPWAAVILHRTESPSGGSNSTCSNLRLSANVFLFCTDHRDKCFWGCEAQLWSLQPSCDSLHIHVQETG